ncbi:MAG: SRPBCC family protein, partial [Acidimicrobiales bacterium]
PGAQLQEVEGDEYRGVVKVKVGPITASYKGAASFSELDGADRRAVLKAQGRETRGQGNAAATITAKLLPSGAGTRVEVVTDLAITGKVAQFGRGVLADVSSKLLDQFVHNLETTVLAEHAIDGGATATKARSATKAPAGAKPAQPKAPVTKTAGVAKGTAGAEKGPAGTTKAEATKAAGATKATASKAAGATKGAADAKPVPESEATEATEANEGAGAAEGAKRAEPPSGPRRIESPEPEPVDLVGVAGGSLAKRLVPFASVAGVLVLARIVVYALRRRKR